jgi:hypothetical protein
VDLQRVWNRKPVIDWHEAVLIPFLLNKDIVGVSVQIQDS